MTLSRVGRRIPQLLPSILIKQTAFVALLIIAAGGTLILAGHEFARSFLREQIDQRLTLAASDRQTLLLAYIEQQQERVALVASRTTLRRLTDEFLSGKIGAEEYLTGSVRILEDARASTDGFRSISIADPTGTVIASTDPAEPGRDYSLDPDLLAGQEERHLGLPQPYSGGYRALLTAPALSSDGRLLGIAAVWLDLGRMVDFLTDRTGLGQTGEIQVATRVGETARFLLPSQEEEGRTTLPLSQVPAMASALRGESGLTQTRDARGVEVLAAYRPVGYLDWGLVAKMDAAEAYAPVESLRGVLLGLVALLLLIGSFGAYILTRRLTRPILDLAESAAAVAAGNLAVRVPVTSADEIGTLARAFNHMTEQLAGSYATLERRVRERTAQLELANRELEAFSYSVSHDLRAPLRAIDGFSQALLEDHAKHLDEGGQDYLRRVRAAAQRMGQLIDDLLKLSRLTRRAVERRRVDLSQMARSAAEQLEQADPNRKVSLRIQEAMVAHADPALVQVVLDNLIGNAWKFSAKNPEPTIEFGATQLDGTEAYFVKDNGVGFDMAYADKLFGPFQRLHRADEFPGSGVGLATVQRIVRRHGGRAWAEATEGRGATFFFTLEPGANPQETVQTPETGGEDG